MLKATLKNPALRKRARQFGRLVRHSAVTPRIGKIHKPRLVSHGQLGLTFIGQRFLFLPPASSRFSSPTPTLTICTGPRCAPSSSKRFACKASRPSWSCPITFLIWCRT